MQTQSLPFKNTDSYEGFAETTGLLRLDGENLNIQFQTKDAILGVVKSDIKDVTIPMDAIDDVEFKKSLWGGKITLRLNQLDLINSLSGSIGGEFTFSVARKNRELGSDVARAIRLALSEYEYDKARAAS